MNKTFNINRFGNVVRYDGMNYFKNFGWTLIVLWALPVVHWVMTYISMEALDAGTINNRLGLISTLMWLSLMIVPSRLYKNINDSKKGIQYAMLPASTLEKFLSMVLYCAIVTPIIYFAGAIVVDTIFALKPGTNPYDGFIFTDLFNKYQRYNDLIQLGDEELNRAIFDYSLTKNIFLYKSFEILCVSSIFMFTNMLFKKRKLSKTIGILTLVGIVLAIVIVRISMNWDFSIMENYTEEEFLAFLKRLIDCMYHVILYGSITLSAVFLYFTSRKIRKQKY